MLYEGEEPVRQRVLLPIVETVWILVAMALMIAPEVAEPARAALGAAPQFAEGHRPSRILRIGNERREDDRFVRPPRADAKTRRWRVEAWQCHSSLSRTLSAEMSRIGRATSIRRGHEPCSIDDGATHDSTSAGSWGEGFAPDGQTEFFAEQLVGLGAVRNGPHWCRGSSARLRHAIREMRARSFGSSFARGSLPEAGFA